MGGRCSGQSAVPFGEAGDYPVQVELVAGVDARHAGLVGEVEAVVSVAALQLDGFAGGALRGGRHGLAVAAAEAERAPCAAFDPVAALVDEAVVVGAEVDEVGQVGAAAACPVVDVVGVQIAALRAAGEAADGVAALERASERRRHAACATADRQRPAVALEDAHQAGVTAETAGGLGMKRSAVLELAGALLVASEGGGVDV